MTAGIYQITNTATGQTYVGSAIDIGARRRRHLDELRRGKHGNCRLRNSFTKNGEGAFEWTTLLAVEDPTRLIEAEQSFLDSTRPYFNICRTAGSRLGTRHTAETKRRLSVLKTGVRHTELTKAKMSRSQVGRTHSNPARQKIAAARTGVGNGMYGKKHPPQTIALIAASSKSRAACPAVVAALEKGRGWNKGVPFSQESRRKMSDAKPKRPVVRTDPATGERKLYPSTCAVRADGFHVSHVGDCCRSGRAHKGFLWAFA